MRKNLVTPLALTQLANLRAGDSVTLSGTVYAARDAAHKRMAKLLAEGKPLPFTLAGSCIYYAGPTPARPGEVVGAVGPTTAGRMDAYTPLLLQHGLAAMIGKGARSPEVLATLQQSGAVYFGFVGGAGALAAAHVSASEVVAWEDLGSEAIRRLTVQSLPLTVLADAKGGDLYQLGPAAFLRWKKEKK